jgi:hypothetical protein
VQPPPDTAPAARFTFQPRSPTTAQTITFDGSTSADGDGDTLTGYRWMFGDGASQTTTTATTTHRYAMGGTFTAQLVVLDSRGTPSSPTTLAVTIMAPPPSPPRVSALKLTPKRVCARKTHRCRHPGARLRFSLSEPAGVVVTVTRRGDTRTLVRLKLVGRTGKNSRAFRVRGLEPGRYVVTLVATSRGLRGKPIRATFRVLAA